MGSRKQLPAVDHLIITNKDYYSFAQGGLMAELAQTKKYLLNSAAQERLKAEARAIGEKVGEAKGKAAGLKAGEVKGREAEKLQVALAMKAEGIEAKVIAKVTGLSVVKVKGLKVPKGTSK